MNLDPIRAWLDDHRFVPSRRFDGDEAVERAYAHTSGYGWVELIFDPCARGWDASVWMGDLSSRVGVGLGWCTRVEQVENLCGALLALDFDKRDDRLRANNVEISSEAV